MYRKASSLLLLTCLTIGTVFAVKFNSSNHLSDPPTKITVPAAVVSATPTVSAPSPVPSVTPRPAPTPIAARVKPSPRITRLPRAQKPTLAPPLPIPARPKPSAAADLQLARRQHQDAPLPPPLSKKFAAPDHKKEEGEGKEKAYDKPGEAAAFYLQKRVPKGADGLPTERYAEARERMKAMRVYSSEANRFVPRPDPNTPATEALAGGAWTNLGPGNIGGRTRTLLINPTNPNMVYAGGVAGGIWRSTDGGVNWTPFGDIMSNMAVCTLVMEPNNPNVMYAGTGEGYFNGDAVRGAGIFKTTNGGITWEQLPATNNANFYYVNKIVISKNDPKRLYAATRRGVWRSLNSGETWTRVFDPVNADNVRVTGGCLDLVIRTDKTTDVVFASCGTFAQATIHRNTDAAGAGMWEAVYTEKNMGRTSLALAPSNQDILYASSASIDPTGAHSLHAVFRSTTGGEAGSWTSQVRRTNASKLNTVLFSNTLFAFYRDCRFSPGDNNAFFHQGWYDNLIAVDPVDANRVWVGGIDLFRSDDGGQNWGQASYWASNGNTAPLAPSYAHADQHVIAFHPNYNGTTNQTMFLGNDGGVFRTDNARAAVATGATGPCSPFNSQVVFTPLNNYYGVTQFYHGAVFPDGKTYFGGTQDNGTVIGSDSAAQNGWREIQGGDGGYVAVNPRNPNTLYAEFTDISLQKSTNGGRSFHAATSGISTYGLFITPFAMDPSDPDRLWMGGEWMLRTTDAATNWENASAYIGDDQLISAIAIAPTNANAVLAGDSSGNLYGTDQALTSTFRHQWDTVQPREGFVSSVAIDPKNENVAYATYSTFGDPHVWKTEDGGANWTPIDGTGQTGIPDIPVHTLVIDPGNTQRLYVGTDLGVFASLDGGATWNLENTGFPNTVVEWLTINVTNGVTTLYAFTHGRGAWKVDISNTGCNFTLNRTGQNIAQTGGTGSVDVATAGNSCEWTASSNDEWLTVNSFNAGTGRVNFTAAANPTFRPRIGTLAVAGRSYTITQPGLTDTTAPKLQIVKPTTEKTFTTKEETVVLQAVIEDNDVVELAEWRNARTFSGILFPTGQGNLWEGNLPVDLEEGVNVITVAVRDRAGNQTSAVINVVRTLNADDKQSPSITITTPTTAPTWITTNSLLTLRGTASDNNSVTHLRWSNDRGGEGSVSGADTWVARNVPLRTGVNKITLTAFDSNGNTATKTLLVLLNLNSYQTTRRVAGLPNVVGFNGDNRAATTATLFRPAGMLFDAQGNLYFADASNHRVRKIAPNGTITTIAGNGRTGQDGDGGPATQASLQSPLFLAFDAQGNLYISDTGNNKVRKVDSSGIITTFAGTGKGAYAGDDGKAVDAALNYPTGIAVDAAGNVFIAEGRNNRIRKVNPSGIITTIAGNGSAGFAGEGALATEASFFFPTGLAFDRNGNLVIADAGNYRIRRMDADGKIRTIVGNGTFGTATDDVDATTTTIGDVYQITYAADGSLYFAEAYNAAISRITPDGKIRRMLGNFFGSFDEGTSPRGLQLRDPFGVAVDVVGNIYASDYGGAQIVAAITTNGAATVEAAGYSGPVVARDSIASVFGQRLATAEASANAAQLPTLLAGTTVTVLDSKGVERQALLFYVSPGQVNYVVPIDAAEGFATVTVRNSLGETAIGFIEIAPVMPGLFTANADGAGAAVGWAIRVRNGAQTRESITVLNAATNKFVAKPIDFDPANEQLFVELYGTGIRYRSGMTNVTCEIGGVAVPVEYAFIAPGFYGLDQVNIRIPASLDNRGEADLVLIVDGKRTKPLKINIK
jgi:uncharacterized protein (TIGR03437 family)